MKDEAGNSATERARVALLHIIDTSRLLRILKSDNRAIFSASAAASRAIDYLYSLQPTTEGGAS